MPNLIKRDFEELLKFLKKYKLDFVEQDKFKAYLSPIHKKYLSLLALISEFLHNDFITSIYKENEDSDDTFCEYLREISSDFGSSLFVSLHGAYKPARLSLRSGIENFFVCLALLIKKEAHTIKNTYDLMEFTSTYIDKYLPKEKKSYQRLETNYDKLCRDVHTANAKNMAKINSLNYFPEYHKEKAEEYVDIFLSSVKAIVQIMLAMIGTDISRIHPDNIDVILKSADKESKKRLFDK